MTHLSIEQGNAVLHSTNIWTLSISHLPFSLLIGQIGVRNFEKCSEAQWS